MEIESVMAKKEKIFLKQLIKLSSNFSDRKIPITNVQDGFNNFYLKRLINKKYIFLDYHEQDNEGNEIIDSVSLSEQGLHYFELKKEIALRFVIRSIATPIVVSATTTLITMFLTWLVRMVIR